MSMTVGDFVVERLHAWGVRRIFGYPGDGINGVLGGMNRTPGKIEFIQARHEGVLEVKTDPEVPPLPPHSQFLQVRHLTSTTVKGDAQEEGIIMDTARQVLSSILPATRSR